MKKKKTFDSKPVCPRCGYKNFVGYTGFGETYACDRCGCNFTAFYPKKHKP